MPISQETRRILEDRLRNIQTTSEPDPFGTQKGIQERIARRGDETFGEAISGFQEAEGVGQKSLAGLNIVAMPQERIEAGIANAMLSLQNGKPGEVLSSFKSGIDGKKLGEIGDVFRRIGVPEAGASTAGLVVSLISPLALVAKANKAIKGFKGVSKITDKGILRAGDDLLKGSDEAIDVVGKNVDKAYAPVNKVAVDTNKVINALDDAPRGLVEAVEKEVGKNIEDIATIADVRKVKQTIGALRPTKFGKSEKALTETLEDININKVYGKVKTIIQDTLTDKNILRTKDADLILKADDAFTETKRAADFVRKLVVDKTLLKPTKAGRAARGILNRGDVGTRQALNTLGSVSKKSSKSIESALDSLNKFNTGLALARAGGRLTRYFLLGGVAGAVGAKTINELTDDE